MFATHFSRRLREIHGGLRACFSFVRRIKRKKNDINERKRTSRMFVCSWPGDGFLKQAERQNEVQVDVFVVGGGCYGSGSSREPAGPGPCWAVALNDDLTHHTPPSST